MYFHCTCQVLSQKLICTPTKEHRKKRGTQIMPCWSCSQAHPRSHHQPKGARGQVGTWHKNSKKGHPACIPPRAGPAQPQPQAWNSPRWVSSAFGTQICHCLGHGTTYGVQGKSIWALHKICVVGHTILVQCCFFFIFISFNGWALDKMHEENNNEKTLRKKSPHYCSCLHTVNVPVYWCLALSWCLPS